MIKKSILIWLAIIPVSIINGILRESAVAPLIGEKLALPASGLTLSLMIFIICLAFIPLLGKGNRKDYINIGLFWLGLTVIFEFIFGLLVMKKTFADLIKAYNFTSGNLWLFVVLFIAIVPWLSAKIRKII